MHSEENMSTTFFFFVFEHKIIQIIKNTQTHGL